VRFAFVVPGPPVPWQRAGKGRHGQFYTPEETRSYQRLVRLAALSAGVQLMACPVSISLRILFPDGRKRDGDNVMKSVCDALQGNGERGWLPIAYQDDSSIKGCEYAIAIDADNPRVEVRLVGELSLEPPRLPKKRRKRKAIAAPGMRLSPSYVPPRPLK
jgi:Holliday junction resolvase RusA-like endonuclease